MNYRYKFKFLLPVLLIMFFSPVLNADNAERRYEKSLVKWEKSGIKEYSVRINYSAFTPLSGVWELEVKDAEVFQCRFNGKAADDYVKTAGMFTMESLYKTAGESVCLDRNGPFIIKITYSKKGFIKSLEKIRNPEYKNKVRTDTSFKIEVLDFVPRGR